MRRAHPLFRLGALLALLTVVASWAAAPAELHGALHDEGMAHGVVHEEGMAHGVVDSDHGHAHGASGGSAQPCPPSDGCVLDFGCSAGASVPSSPQVLPFAGEDVLEEIREGTVPDDPSLALLRRPPGSLAIDPSIVQHPAVSPTREGR
jgi:hypothetical protein